MTRERHFESGDVLTEDLVDLKSLCEVDHDGCWIPHASGYFLCRTRGDQRPIDELPTMKAHRWAWLVKNDCAANKRVAASIHVRRRCGKRRCCNPEHLFATTLDGDELSSGSISALKGEDGVGVAPPNSPSAPATRTEYELAQDDAGWGTVLTEDLAELAGLCNVDPQGCWLAPSNGGSRCRANSDSRQTIDLPKISAHRWAWMVQNELAASPVPSHLIQIRRRCQGKTCCNPEHLFPSLAGGEELSLKDALTVIKSGSAAQQRVRAGGSDHGRVVFEEDLAAMESLCRVTADGCWISPISSAPCRASGDYRNYSALPRMAPHRWAWMIANGQGSDPLPGSMFNVQRRCSSRNCCNPKHLCLTTPDGREVSLMEAHQRRRSGQTQWPGSGAGVAEHGRLSSSAVTFPEDLDAMRSLCKVDSDGCWIAGTGGPAACRANGDGRPYHELPKMAPHRWTWMIANGRASTPLPGNKFQVRRRCANQMCCNPEHLYLTAPDGQRLAKGEADEWSKSEFTNWQDTSRAERISESYAMPSLPTDQGPSAEHAAFVDRRPQSWLDAFPWLKGAAEVGTSPWWDAPIQIADCATRDQFLAKISELAMERLTHWTIGEVFPGLSPELEIDRLDIPARAINSLIREGCHTTAGLTGITLDELMDWRQVGAGTVDAILQALAEASMSIATPTVTRELRESAAIALELPYDTPARVRKQKVLDDLTRLAEWHAMIDLPVRTLLGGALPPGTPAAVVEAHQRMESLKAEDVLTTEELELNVARFFDLALGQLDQRAVEVLQHRLFADEILTLDEIGRRQGVTRERIRQIEGKARGAMMSIISGEGPLAGFAEAARAVIGTIRALDDLLELLPALAGTVQAVEQPAWRVLDRLDDAYEIEDGWCVVPTLTAAQTMTQTQLQEHADKYGVVRLENFSLIECEDPVHRKELIASWLAHCGYVIDGEFVLTRTQSVADYGAAVLSLAGTPLSVQEIVDRFVFERTPGSLRNAMALDDRFERIDRQRWALREWGMEAYAGIRTLIRELIAKHGGRIKLNDLIEHITGQYSVSANSVITYASSLPFEQRDGVVALAGSDRQVRKAPESTRRLFRCPGGWAYRVRISKDQLRGSGSAAPMAIASILGLRFGQTRQLDSRLGPQTVAWTGTQPSFGTIRRFLMDGDVSAGTEAFLVIRDDGTFSFEAARDLTGDALTDALSLCGAEFTNDPETARARLAAAIGLTEAAPVSSVIGAYRERGDGDIAELVTSVRDFLESGHAPPVPNHNAEIAEILDLL